MATPDNETADDVLVAALASGLSYQEAAKVGCCSKSTVARRMREREFRDRVAEERAEYASMIRGRLLHAQPAAIEVLVEVMSSAQSNADRIRAARSLLEAQRKDRYLDVSDVDRAVRAIVDIAMTFVPEEDTAACLAQLRGVG